MIVYIYDLSDPRTGCVRYIGKSVRPAERLATHIREAREGSKTHCKRWIAGLLSRGLRPVLRIVEESTSADANDAERYWIGSLRLAGADLTNRTPGGDGQPAGYRPSVETVAKLRIATAGRKATPEQRVRMSEAFMRPEVRARRSELLKERYADPAQAIAITGPTRGTRLSSETKMKMAAAWTPARKAAHAAEKSGQPFDERWRVQLAAALKVRWEKHRAASSKEPA